MTNKTINKVIECEITHEGVFKVKSDDTQIVGLKISREGKQRPDQEPSPLRIFITYCDFVIKELKKDLK